MTGRFTRILLTLVLAVAAGTVTAYSQDTKKQESRKARIQKEIAILDGQIKAITSKSASAMNKLSLIRKKVDARKELVAESDREIAGFSSSIASKEKQIKQLQAHLDTLSDYYGKLVSGAYKNRNAKVWYMYILASDNLGQAFRRYGYMRDLSRQLNTQATEIIATRDTLEKERAALAGMKQEAEVLRKQRVSEVGRFPETGQPAQERQEQIPAGPRQEAEGGRGPEPGDPEDNRAGTGPERQPEGIGKVIHEACATYRLHPCQAVRIQQGQASMAGRRVCDRSFRTAV